MSGVSTPVEANDLQDAKTCRCLAKEQWYSLAKLGYAARGAQYCNHYVLELLAQYAREDHDTMHGKETETVEVDTGQHSPSW